MEVPKIKNKKAYMKEYNKKYYLENKSWMAEERALRTLVRTYNNALNCSRFTSDELITYIKEKTTP